MILDLVVKSAETASRGPTMKTRIKQPPIQMFMDNMTVAARLAIDERWMLEDLEKLITWARMRFNQPMPGAWC